MIKYIYFTCLLALWVSAGAGFAHRAHARTVSVKEIVRPPEAATTKSIPLSHSDIGVLTQLKHHSELTIARTPLAAATLSLGGTVVENQETAYDPAAAYSWLVKNEKIEIDDTEDARLVIEGGRVVDFSPGNTGMAVDFRKSALNLLEGLAKGAQSVELAGLQKGHPRTLAQTNNLGINEFLAGGVSDFSGSSKNRRANIAAGIKKVKGVLIAPGETFSFNKYLGDVTAEDGFKPEIVIKADGLKPELGGGICQVSSTLFRAAIQAGFPIVTRKNHAFSVNHYFPPGTDATVYSPYTDLKFTNDTSAHVLIWPRYSGDNTLLFDLYGTRDGRSVTVDEPIQWDRKPDGSMKASWTRHVTKDGTTRDDTLKSNYLPPALFKKEEKFVSAPQTPQAPPMQNEQANPTHTPPQTPPTPTAPPTGDPN